MVFSYAIARHAFSVVRYPVDAFSNMDIYLVGACIKCVCEGFNYQCSWRVERKLVAEVTYELTPITHRRKLPVPKVQSELATIKVTFQNVSTTALAQPYLITFSAHKKATPNKQTHSYSYININTSVKFVFIEIHYL